jgi:hypothetical protein
MASGSISTQRPITTPPYPGTASSKAVARPTPVALSAPPGARDPLCLRPNLNVRGFGPTTSRPENRVRGPARLWRHLREVEGAGCDTQRRVNPRGAAQSYPSGVRWITPSRAVSDPWPGRGTAVCLTNASGGTGAGGIHRRQGSRLLHRCSMSWRIRRRLMASASSAMWDWIRIDGGLRPSTQGRPSGHWRLRR